MNNFIEDYIDQELVLTNLQDYPEDIQKEILNKIEPNNFEEMIFVSDFYLRSGKFRELFLQKISKITSWKTYFDQDPPMDFIMVFMKDAKIDLTDIDLVKYYLTHFKVPIPVFKNYFDKIYHIVLLLNQNNRVKLRKESTLYNGIFALQGPYELLEILDYLIRMVQESGLNSSYSDVLIILLEFLKLRDDVSIPHNRLIKLDNLRT
jgi:hypothetical protein